MRFSYDISGGQGLLFDPEPNLLPPNAWSGGSNVRMRDGSVESVPGYRSVLGTASVAPTFLMPFRRDAAATWVYGDATSLHSTEDGTTHTERTRAGGAYTGDGRWSGAVLNGVAYATNGVDEPQAWQQSAGRFVDLSTVTAGWTAGDSCRVLRRFGQYLLAFDVTESGTRNPRLLRWSHPANPGAVPSSWDYSDPTLLAGRQEVVGRGDHVLDFAMLGDTGLIYGEASVAAMRYLGNLDVFSVQELTSDFGLLARGCVDSVGNTHVLITSSRDLVALTAGGSATPLLTGRQRAWFRNLFQSADPSRSFLRVNRNSNEVLAFIAASGSHTDYPTRVFSYNWATKEVGLYEMPGLASAASGVFDATLTGAWDAQTGLWDDEYEIWDEFGVAPGEAALLAASPETGKIYLLGVGSTADGSALISSVERVELPFEDLDTQTRKWVSGIHPRMDRRTSGQVQWWIGTKDALDGGYTWNGPHNFDPATQEKIDVRVAGRWIAVRVRHNGVGRWRLSGFDLEAQPEGLR